MTVRERCQSPLTLAKLTEPRHAQLQTARSNWDTVGKTTRKQKHNLLLTRSTGEEQAIAHVL